jgi:hypothetical protein
MFRIIALGIRSSGDPHVCTFHRAKVGSDPA